MKISTRALGLAALPLLSLASLARAAAPAEDFREAFEKALQAGDQAAMKSLVADNQDDAVALVMSTCEAISERTSEKLEKRIAALREAWQQAFDTKFVAYEYEYFSLLRPEIRSARNELKPKYDEAVARFQQALADEEYRDLPALGYDFEGYAKGFHQLGDLYYASEAWLNHAWCFEERYLGDDANLEASYVGFQQGIALREQLGLMDSRLAEAKERFAVLDEAGVGDPDTVFEGSLAGKAKREAQAAAAVTVGLQFEVIDDIESVPRPSYIDDIAYQMWPTLPLEAEGSSTTFPYVEDSPPILRAGPAQAGVDTDRDGKVDVEIPLTGSIVPVELTLGTGDEARPWAFLACIGQLRDRYQGFDMNLEPSQEGLPIYVAPAASLVGEVEGVPIRVFDDNMDGVYGSEPKFWSNPGTLSTGAGQADFDSILVGKEKRARPWSPVMQLGDAWYRMEISGTELTATPMEVETATLELDFEGPKPDYVIVQGFGDFDTAYFDLVPGGKKGTAVPAGIYRLVTGRISKGRRNSIMKALIVPPPKPLDEELEPGEEFTFELGAPFGFAFDVTQDDTSVTVVGTSVAVTGRGGETYERLWNCVVEPEVSVRKVGSKRGGKGEEMKIATHQDDVTALGWDAVWFPFDLTLEKEHEGEEVEVQLTQKKHKLFGKIESEWRK